MAAQTCVHMRGSRIFYRGSRPDGKKTVWTTFFFLNLFYSLQRGSNVFLLQRKLYFSKDSEGVHIFQGGGVQLFPGRGCPNAYFWAPPPGGGSVLPWSPKIMHWSPQTIISSAPLKYFPLLPKSLKIDQHLPRSPKI